MTLDREAFEKAKVAYNKTYVDMYGPLKAAIETYVNEINKKSAPSSKEVYEYLNYLKLNNPLHFLSAIDKPSLQDWFVGQCFAHFGPQENGKPIFAAVDKLFGNRAK